MSKEHCKTIFRNHLGTATDLFQAQIHLLNARKEVEDLTKKLEEAKQVLIEAEKNMRSKQVDASKAYDKFQSSVDDSSYAPTAPCYSPTSPSYVPCSSFDDDGQIKRPRIRISSPPPKP